MAARSQSANIFSVAGGPGKLPAFSLLAMLFLAACAAAPETIKRVPRVVEDARVIAADQAEAEPEEDGGEDSDKPGEDAEEEEKKEEEKSEEAAALPVDLTNFKDRLLGLDNDDLSDLLGAPSLEREEPPATIWQYRTPACVVDVFLYSDGGENQVDHVEVRGRETDEVDEPKCFAAIIKDKDKVKAPVEDLPSPKKPAAKAPAKAPTAAPPPDADAPPPDADAPPPDADAPPPDADAPPDADVPEEGDQLPPPTDQAPAKGAAAQPAKPAPFISDDDPRSGNRDLMGFDENG
ncbi:MAG: hypothetical protein HN632_03915 [Rhodospirillaceae bacterium]|nr:hypothetical protein [Rhodospirillaceae bacterium]